MRRAVAAVAAAATLAAVPARAAAPSHFWTGFADSGFETAPAANVWFERAVAADARFVLLPVDWAAIAPHPPASDPTNPTNPAYRWGTLDQTVRGAVAHGLAVAFTIAGGGGPAWADGLHRPANVKPGLWRPGAAAFGAFVEAVARRYSGRFNPGTGTLPHVRYYQAWSEPNLYNHLMPQWVRKHGRWIAESPVIYRGLLNAAYRAVKTVDRSDLVVTAGTAPFGDRPGGRRMQPALFVRTLLCIGGSGSELILLRCPNPARFDILAHHPYSAGGPWWRAFNADDVSVPDLWKLTRPLTLAVRTGRALPRSPKQLWVTEFSWDSTPPNPRGVPMAMWEHWLEESFYVLWSQGVDAIAWYPMVDQPCVPNCAVTYQSGVYYANGAAKPGLAGYRFPFVVEPSGRGRAVIWGLADGSGTVTVQVKEGSGWRAVARFRRTNHAIFTRAIAARPGEVFRARLGSQVSPTWRFTGSRCQPASECDVFGP